MKQKSAQKLLSIDSALAKKVLEIKQLQARYHLAAQGADVGIWDWDLTSNTVFYSQRWKEMLGFGETDNLNTPEDWLNLIHPDHLMNFRKAIEAHLAGKTPRFAIDYKIRNRDGQFLWVSNHGIASWDKNGEPIRIVGAQSDISERKASEKRLIEREMQMRTIFDSVSDGIISMSDLGSIRSFNQSAGHIFGYTSIEVLGESIDKLIPFFSFIPKRYIHPHLIPTQKIIGKCLELEGKCKEGIMFPIEVILNRVDLEGSTIFTCVIRDVTERKIMEEEKKRQEAELFQTQKLESLGTLAGGIAHEINTPLQYIGDNIRFMQDALPDVRKLLKTAFKLKKKASAIPQLSDLVDELDQLAVKADLVYLNAEIPNAITQSLEGLDHVTRIVQAIREFSHPSVKEKVPTNLNRAIETTLMVTSAHWKNIAEMKTDFDESLPLVPCLPGEFNQVMLNLILNAAHAIEAAKRETKGHIKVMMTQDEEYAVIEIADDGIGIPKAIHARIFDPFFTTKKPGVGTGQGLSIVHTIVVQKHQGSISFSSEEGKGTVFIVRIPLNEGTAENDEHREAWGTI